MDWEEELKLIRSKRIELFKKHNKEGFPTDQFYESFKRFLSREKRELTEIIELFCIYLDGMEGK